MFAGKSSWIVQYIRSKQAVGLSGILVKPSWASSR
jgi:thymidine kinase